MDELLTASAGEQARAIRTGAVSSYELVRAHLERIALINPTLNAVVQSSPESALAAARTADDAVASGAEPGPLHGVPFTVKDWIETSDLICAAGFEERASFQPRHDATVVARMRAAGAILLGKTNVQESNPVYGPTRNPYDPARSPGASSSGEASLISACGSPIGLGSDSGGSLRYPAHCCGVATLKPTTGRVPLTGHFPRIGASHDPRTVIGPLSRHVDDLWSAFAVIAGVDWRDPSAVPVPLGERPAGIAAMRIGWFTEMPGAEPTPETLQAVQNAVSATRDAGARTEEVLLPRIEESMPLTRAYWSRIQSPSWNDWLPPHASTLSADDVERSIFEWDRFRRSLLPFMAQFDALICPAAASPAPPHGSVTAESYTYTLPFSLTGWPVVTMRAGTAPGGLPIGVQVVARPWREADAIEVASVVESALAGWQAPNI